MTWNARRLSGSGLVAQRRRYDSRSACGSALKRTARPVSARFRAGDSMVSRSWSSSATSAGRPSASTSWRSVAGTPSALAEGSSPSAGTKASQIAASARARSATRPAYRSHFEPPLQIHAALAPRADRGRHEDPDQPDDRHREQRAEDAPELEPDDESEDSGDGMDADGVR